MKDPPADDVIAEPVFAPKTEEPAPIPEIVKKVKKVKATVPECDCEEEPSCGCAPPIVPKCDCEVT